MLPVSCSAGASYQNWFQSDGHVDAVRHAFWSAELTRVYGRAFAEQFTMAHEEVGNIATKEAMDLYNNSIGIRIAVQNPGATQSALYNLVRQAVLDGEMVVIDSNRNLAWSDQVQIFDHGLSQTGDGGILLEPLSSPVVVPPTFIQSPPAVTGPFGSGYFSN